MSLSINVSNDLSKLTSNLTSLQRQQLPYANSVALTSTIWNAREFARDGLVRDLDKVSNFTLNAFTIKKANKNKQIASIELKPIQSQYLGWTTEGGTKDRPTISLPASMRRVTRATYNKWIAREDTFQGTIKGIRGLWQRIGKYRVKLLFAYETTAQYEPHSWRYYDDVSRAINTRFAIHWNKAMIRALATAR